MSAAGKDTLALLRYYSLKHKTPAIEFDAFLPFVERYIARYRNERPGLEELASDTVNELTLQLDELSQTQACSVSYENGRIKTITFPHYYADMVLEAYRSLEDNPEHPFPSRDLLPADIPDDLVRTINIQTEFMQIIEEPEQFRGRILRLVFPDQIREMIITAELAKRKLIELCIVKVRLYLNTQRNAD